MLSDAAYVETNRDKYNMAHLYNQPDPRAYSNELGMFGYVIPGNAKPVFQELVARLRHDDRRSVCILDLGCSYGINAALLKHNLSMSQLYEHWGQEALAGVTPKEMIAKDKRFFDGLGTCEGISVIGLDPAEPAISYAKQVGLLDDGYALNLEKKPLPAEAAENLRSVELIISTGCVGYVTEKTFGRLLPAVTQGRLPWIGNFVLRMFSFDAIAEILKDWGYVTEKLEGRTFIQRRFTSPEEQKQLLERLRERGVDPAGKEAKGHLLAEFYLSRPAVEAAKIPIERLFAS